MVKVFVCEEYGYREWEWLFSGTVEELIAFWQSLKSVEGFFFNPSVGLSEFGRVRQLRSHRARQSAYKQKEAYAHMHTDMDSYLAVKGKQYVHAGFERMK